MKIIIVSALLFIEIGLLVVCLLLPVSGTERIGFNNFGTERNRITGLTVFKEIKTEIIEVTSETPEYIILMRGVHNNHTWTKDVFMCGDFSSELFYLMEERNYDVWFCKGRVLTYCDPETDDFNCLHYWIKALVNDSYVFLDPSFGSEATLNEYNRGYDEFRCKRNPFK